jgi:hypothetical protein
VLVVTIALVGAACAERSTSGDRVLVIGDSLLDDSEAQVRDALAADGWKPLVNGIGGIPMQSWIPGAKKLATTFKPNVVVVELGTNNCAVTPCEDLDAYIDALMHEFTKTADVVYWLNVQDLPNNHPADEDFVNREITDAAIRWPNLVVVDMNSRFKDRPDWHRHPDGLHFNDAGKQALGDLIREALHDISPATRG